MTGIGNDPFDELVTNPAAPIAASPPRSSVGAPRRRRSGTNTRRTFELPTELIERAREVVWALTGPPHQLTLNRLAANALRRELERLEHEHNDGHPFPPRAGALRPGRRLAS
jgi:hypothetical protein